MKEAPRRSKCSISTVYSAKKIGICSSIGRQPPTGFTFSRRYRSMVAWFRRSGLPLNFSRSSWICGWSCAIRLVDSELLRVSGKNTTLMKTVSRMIATP